MTSHKNKIPASALRCPPSAMEGAAEMSSERGGTAVVPVTPPSTDVNGTSTETSSSNEPVAIATETSAAVFLEQAGLGFLVPKFKEAGFLSKEDVICLTPRKYEVLGVEGLGTKIRLKRTIEDAQYSRARVRVAGEVLEFRMPLGACVGDLRSVISKQTYVSLWYRIGIRRRAFAQTHHRCTIGAFRFRPFTLLDVRRAETRLCQRSPSQTTFRLGKHSRHQNEMAFACSTCVLLTDLGLPRPLLWLSRGEE